MTYLEALSIMKVQPSFTKKQLKEAFRRSAKKVHPDHSGQEEDFKMLKAAYDYLRNNRPERVFSKENLSKLNLDIVERISISFVDACTGCIKKVKFSRYELTTKPHVCEICLGRGWICRETRPIEKCNVCAQTVRPRYVEKNIRIPAGICQGNKLSFKGEGNTVDNMTGILNLKIDIEKTKDLERKDHDIVQIKDVKYSDLLLGKSLIANTIHGDIKVDIPFGSFDGDMIRVKGRGVKSKNKTGHHVLKLRLIAPKSLSENQKDALEALRETGL